MNAQDTTQRRAHWQTVYETKAADEVSWFQETPSVSLDLIGAAELGPEAGIIDVGAGASTLVDHLLQAGYRNLAALDIAQAALKKSQQRLGGDAVERIDWIVADVTRWTPPRRFDLWHDRAVFHFLTRPEEQQAYVTTLKRSLNPGGHAIIAAFAPDGPERCSGLPVMRHGFEGLAEILGADFTRIGHRRETHQTPAGRAQAFLYQHFLRQG